MALVPRPLSDAERLDWLRLIRSENIGPVTFFQLLGHFGSAAEALREAPELSRRGGRARAIRIQPRAEAEREAAALAALGGRLIAWGETNYPEPLAAIYDPPPVISVLGHPHMLTRRAVAVVGARNASAAGVRFALDIARALGKAGLVIVSGLARGIDTAAHQGALETGTVAVMAGGVDVAYPRENAALHQRIVEAGAALSEQPLGVHPVAQHFPRRNRLISGAALGVLVIEAAARSGSLITARMALEQGREVFAVPGSPLDPRCKGTNQLIRDGATLTESADDVIDGLSGVIRPAAGEPGAGPYAPPAGLSASEDELDRARPMVVEKLGPTPVTVDELVRQCQMSPAGVQTILLELELAGRLERLPGARVARVS